MLASAEIARSQPASEPDSLGAGRLRQFLAYAKKVFGIERLLDAVRDRRKEPRVPASMVARIVLLLGVLRIRSFNALEPKLAEPWM